MFKAPTVRVQGRVPASASLYCPLSEARFQAGTA
jgi:hypothetical protein